MSLPDLYFDFIGRDAMAFACHRWHYSDSVPASKIVGVGVWEAKRSCGAVVFGRGASSEIASPFGLQQSEICELCRVALGPHVTPTSRILALSVRLLRKQSPGLRLIVSYADPEHGHVGTLYQACGWLYLGTTNRESLIRLHGRTFHPRTVASRYGTRGIDWLRRHVAPDAGHVRTLPKFRYTLPLDDDMRRQLAPRVQPYPKALVVERDRSTESGARGTQAGVLSPCPAATSTREGTLRNDPVAPLHEAAYV